MRINVKLMAVMATLAVATLFAGESVTVETANTMMIFERVRSGAGERLFMRHYGEKFADVKGALALALCHGKPQSSLSTEEPSVYSVFGETNRRLNRFGGLKVTHCDGSLTLDLIVEKIERVNGDLVVRWRDAVYDFRVNQHFITRGDTDMIETWVEIVNGEKGAVRISRMSSLSFIFPFMANDWRLMSLTGEWCSEGEVVETQLSRGRRVTLDSRSGVRDAWLNNPSFMLSIDGPSTETNGRVMGAALCWSGAWEMSFRLSEVDMLEVTAGPANVAGDYVLDSGKSITLPVVALTYSDKGKGQVSRNFHRWARRYWMPNGKKERPTLLNNWEGTGFAFDEPLLHEIMDGAQKLGVEMFVLDDAWFGRGKFARNDDTHGLGDWCVNTEKLPHGLAGLAEEAKKRNLKFGFWVEPEMANWGKCDLLAKHPEWALQEKSRPMRLGRGGTQVVLDLVNPAVREDIWRQLDVAYSSVPGLAYIKWDANANIDNVGSTYLDDAHQANLYFDYTLGYYDILKRQRSKYPNLDIQACSSGGGHMEYGSLKYCDEFWTSDNTDPRDRVKMQWGASMFYPASAIASHVTRSGRNVPFKYRVDVAFSGRFGFEMQPKHMKGREIEFAKSAVKEYHRIRPIVQQGDLYRLVSPYEHDYSALMFVDESKENTVVCVYGLSRDARKNYPPPLKLQGLDPAKRYRLKEINTEFWRSPHSPLIAKPTDFVAEMRPGELPSGESLMKFGLPIILGDRDYDSAIFVLTAENSVKRL
jgi:alpha-galactosidase